MATLSSTSRIQMRYAKESVFGEINPAATTHDVKITGESLNFDLTKEASNEINANRGVSSMATTQAQASGSLNGEMQFAEYDEFIAAALQNTWTAFGTDGETAPVDITVTATTITASAATTGVDDFSKLKPGQWIMLGGVTGVNATELLRVSKTVPATNTVITLDANTPATPGAFPTATIRVARLTNGVIQPSYTLEREASDATEFFAYRGMTVSSFNLNIATASLSTVEFAFMGRDAIADDATMLPTPSTPSTGYKIMTGVDGKPCALWVDGAPLAGTFINSIALSYDNNLRMQNALCSLGAVGIGSGTINCSVDIEVYFASGRAFYDEFLANKDVEIVFTAFDSEGNGYVFTMPVANISTYSLNAGGKDQDLMASITLTGLMDMSNSDPDLRGKVLFIDRIGAPMVP